jgi:PAS domain S-box-containing protein
MVLKNTLLILGCIFPLNWIILRIFDHSSFFDFSERFLLSILCFISYYLIQSSDYPKKNNYITSGFTLLFILTYFSIYKSYLSHFSIESVLLSFLIFILSALSITEKSLLFIYFILNFLGNFISSSLSLKNESFIQFIISYFITNIGFLIILYNNINEKNTLFLSNDYIDKKLLNIKEGIIITDKFSNIIYINNPAILLISDTFKADFLIGTKINFPVDYENKYLGIPQIINLPDGKILELQYSTIIWNQELCKFISLKNITSKISNEFKEKNQNILKELTLQFTNDGLITLDKDGFIILINNKALSYFNTSEEEFIGLHYNSFIKSSFSEEQEEFSNHPIFIALTENKNFSISQEVFWRLDGTHFYVEYDVSHIIKDSTNKGVVITFRDTTFKKQKDENNELYKNELLHLTYTANKLLEAIREEDLYITIAKEIHYFFSNSCVIINLYDPISNSFTTVSTAGFMNKMNEIYTIIGRDINGISFIDESFDSNNQYLERNTSLFMLKYGNFNRKICSQLEVATESKEIISLPFIYKSLFLGNCILFWNETKFEYSPTLEVLQNQISVNLYRLYSTKSLFRDRLRDEPLIQNISLLYVETSKEGIILFINPGFAKLSGYSYQECIGKNLWSLFLREFSYTEIQDFQSNISQNPIHEFKTTFYTAHNSIETVIWDWVLRISPDSKGEILAGIGRK